MCQNCKSIPVNRDNTQKILVVLTDLVLYEIAYLSVGIFLGEGNCDIKNKICMSVTANESEIVDVKSFVDLLNERARKSEHLVYLGIVGNDGVHMYRCVNIESAAKLLFNVVDHIVRIENIALAVNLNVKGNDCNARAVVVNDHIVNSESIGELGYDLADLLKERGVGSFAENGVFGFVEYLDARDKDHDSHDRAHDSVGVKACEFANDHGDQNRKCCDSVGKAIRGGRLHNRGIDLIRKALVKEAKPKLNDNGYAKHDKDYKPRLLGSGRRIEYLFDRGGKKIPADDENEERNDH